MPRSDTSPLAPTALLAVLIGGMVGTALRLGVDAVVPSDTFPWSTLTVNVVGSFVLAALVARWWRRMPDWLRAGTGAGLLGAFTTFSAVMVSLVSLGTGGNWLVAGAYLAASVVLGLAAAVLGFWVARGPAPTGVIDEVNE